MIFGYVRAMSRSEINKNVVIDLADEIKNKYSNAEIVSEGFNNNFYALNNLINNLKVNDIVVVNGLERLGRDIRESIGYILSILETGADVHILNYTYINKDNFEDIIRIIEMTEYARNQMYKERRSLSTINSKSISSKKQGKPRINLDSKQVFDILEHHTQQEAANILGVSRSTITRFLRNNERVI